MSGLCAAPVPAWLAQRPLVAGLVVPWVTPRTSDGRYLLGHLDGDKQQRCLTGSLCPICGTRLERPLVLLLRHRDLPRQCTSEPGCHPVCAAYTRAACPMVAGRMSHHRCTPARLDENMTHAPDTPARLGAPAEVWYTVWLTTYRVIVDPASWPPSYAGIPPLRIRPVAPSGDGPPDHLHKETS